MLRVKTIATLVILAATTSAATAEEHTIMLMGDGYFPEVSYVQAGDTVRFVNVTEVSQSATASDESWTSGMLSAEESFELQLEADTVLTFASDHNSAMTGALSYEPAPLASNGD